METRHGEPEYKWSRGSLLEATVMVMALVVPWAVMGTVLRSRPNLGFYIGFTSGTVCLLLAKPKRIKTAAIIAFYCAVLMLHFILGPAYIR